MSALRCSMCGVSWPNDHRFTKCPECGDSTDLVGNIKPTLSLADALSQKAEAEFERFYTKWDSEQPAARLELTAREQLLCANGPERPSST